MPVHIDHQDRGNPGYMVPSDKPGIEHIDCLRITDSDFFPYGGIMKKSLQVGGACASLKSIDEHYIGFVEEKLSCYDGVGTKME